MQEAIKAIDFDGIQLKLASPDDIHRWSHGEITKPETINYRTQRAEKDGLFCERIFGPTKDWECYCGKYKKIRYKGMVCDKCGVEVTRASVRRERMGHIDLAVPVSHIWFLRGVPSRIGMFLNISIQNLEKVIYFASFIITKVNEDLKNQTMEQIKQEFKSKKKQIEGNYSNQANQLRESFKGQEGKEHEIEQRIVELSKDKDNKVKELEKALSNAEKELKDLKPLKIISEIEYQDLSLKYGHVFEAGIGAEAVRKLLEKIDMDKLIKELDKEAKDPADPKYEKLIRRIKLVKSFKMNKLRPEWMVLNSVPVVPPDLRPMVALDGGRFATSDLNDLYRRVINRNNRLKQLVELKAPEVICRNEKRMLQEAVDALIDNSARHGKTVVASTGQKRMLKSLADMLKGKQGRFRQNLLGKRVDYSGRSVIVVGPKLRLHQCGLPKKMALELFKPFVMSQLIKEGYVYNVRSAGRFIESGRDEIWDILENIIKDSYVMLNRAPTLHRLGIQAFKPILIEGKAIQIHPLVCTAFNADFDGDQMAVHVPLTEEARWEAANIMLSSKNLLGPATGKPITNPNQDMVWGAYYLSYIKDEDKIDKSKLKYFYDQKEALLAYNSGAVKLQQPILVRVKGPKFPKGSSMIVTSVGRIVFNEVLPEKIKFVNDALDKKKLSQIVNNCLEEYETEKVAKTLDRIKEITFIYLTKSGMSPGMGDLPDISEKSILLTEAERKVGEIEGQYDTGLLTYEEKHIKVIETWNSVKDKVVELAAKTINHESPFYTMVTSGARGAWGQLGQIIGMRGLQANPAGDIIELPVKSNFRDGIDVLEYFISTHGARKGLSDTALRTSNAGYLTRRLVDVSQDVVIGDKDCKDKEGMVITAEDSKAMGKDLIERIIGRYALQDIINPKTKQVIVKKGDVISHTLKDELEKAELKEVKIRGILSCKAKRGVCQKCYGYDLGFNKPVELGTSVGIIAAQSIGEPGTQLTMRTFHTGGIAGVGDITQGLPRVEEIFEVRTPLKKAIICDVDALVNIEIVQRAVKDMYTGRMVTTEAGQKILRLRYDDMDEDKYKFNAVESGKKSKKTDVKVKDGQEVKEGDVLFVRMMEDKTTEQVRARRRGKVKVDKSKVVIIFEAEKVKEFVVPQGMGVLVKDGEMVKKGQQLTEGSFDLQQCFKLRGREETQQYIIKEIQHIYSSQGQRLHDKHIEVIARQLFSKVYIQDAGDADFLPGEVIDRLEAEEANKLMEEKGKKSMIYKELLLGITKVSLATKSFLSAASFIETSRVLINAATTGKVDWLEGLKENVIIGRLVPAGTGFKDYTRMKEDLKAKAEIRAKELAKAEVLAVEAPVESVEASV